MGIHETIDRFLARTPRQRAAIFLLFAVAIVGVLVFVFWLGARAGDGWAASRYDRQRAENLIRATRAEAAAERLRGENDLLRKQNEEVAAERDKADKRLKAENAEADRRRETELRQRLNQIDQQSDAAAVICGTCQAARDSGYPLSAEFCGQCFVQ